jgi:hypothetical protein
MLHGGVARSAGVVEERLWNLQIFKSSNDFPSVGIFKSSNLQIFK